MLHACAKTPTLDMVSVIAPTRLAVPMLPVQLLLSELPIALVSKCWL